MRIVNLMAYRSHEVVSVLEELLALAKAGDVTALAFVIQAGPLMHKAGISGDYRRHPGEAIPALLTLKNRLLLEISIEDAV